MRNLNKQRFASLTSLYVISLVTSFCMVAVGQPPYFFSSVAFLSLFGWSLFFFSWMGTISIAHWVASWVWSLFVHLYWLRGFLRLAENGISGFALLLCASLFCSLQWILFLKSTSVLREKFKSFSPFLCASLWTLFEFSRLWIWDGFPLASVGLSISSSPLLNQLVCLGGPLFLSHWCIWFCWSVATSLVEKRISISFLLSFLMPIISRLSCVPASDENYMSFVLVNTQIIKRNCHHSVEEVWTDWSSELSKFRNSGCFILFPENVFNHDLSFPLLLYGGKELFFCSHKKFLQCMTKEHNIALFISLPREENTRLGPPEGYIFEKGNFVRTFTKRYLVPGYETPYFNRNKYEKTKCVSRTFLIDKTLIGAIFCLESMLPWSYEECLKEQSDVFFVLSNYEMFGFKNALFDYQLQLSRLYAKAFGLPIVYSTNCGVSGAFDSRGKELTLFSVPLGEECHRLLLRKFDMPIKRHKTIFCLLRTKYSLFLLFFLSFSSLALGKMTKNHYYTKM
ncbi:nitrilase-related carbon-nitrogen hydrolase [Candidatus Similichlamydia epinepheli]|uniref:nitrilase-related carbon-nitrogen hydrolase n=1 Tax=Candidatus Similichlamydia epinepheli TaxID=1903953 RepID=UPI001300472D|nr:nitrilase-related carbon-nitrogen hydrolase [Candidatus Similichlamydia epinepheli]